MLVSLSIRNIVLIDQLDIAFGPGLSVLTGETGAGKSILLDSLALALGGRAGAGLLRAGAEQAGVSAAFELSGDHQAFRILDAAGMTAGNPDDGATNLILRRALGPDGRSRAFINDQPVSAGLMRDVGAALVEIHGQHDERGLLNPAGHRDLLDAAAGLSDLVGQCSEVFRELGELEEHHRAAEQAIRDARGDEEFSRHALGELENLAPEGDEEESLATLRSQLMQGEKLGDELDAARKILTERDGVEARLRGAQHLLERVAAKTDGDIVRAVDGILTALDKAALEAGEALALLEETGAALAFEPQRLEQVEERLFALRAAARKYHCTVDELPAVQSRFADQIQNIDDGGSRLTELAGMIAECRARYDALATDLRDRRIAAAAKIDKAVNRELKPLKLEKASFRTMVEALPEGRYGPFGIDQVSFQVSTNPGAPFGGLLQIASGGELSRFMLAIKVALASGNGARTMIFDEIDRGVGGATADAVGERLARLTGDKKEKDGTQVIVVTHSPQVAARGDYHWLLAKAEQGGKAVTSVESLGDLSRREEIARMLAGAEITDAARAAADQLLAAASS